MLYFLLDVSVGFERMLFVLKNLFFLYLIHIMRIPFMFMEELVASDYKLLLRKRMVHYR